MFFWNLHISSLLLTNVFFAVTYLEWYGKVNPIYVKLYFRVCGPDYLYQLRTACMLKMLTMVLYGFSAAWEMYTMRFSGDVYVCGSFFLVLCTFLKMNFNSAF